MIAPPRPPAHEELEALIKEARARQRRRRLLAAVAIASLAAAGLAVHAVEVGRGTTSAGAARSGGSPLCSMASLALQAVDMSNPTGLGRTALAFTNRSGTPCRADGYPTVSLGDSTGTIPFAYAHMGAAHPVTIPPHGTAYVVVSKFRCDVGTQRWTTTSTVTLRGEGRQVTLDGPALCKPGIPSEGRIVMLYPFKRSLQVASQASLAQTP